MSLYSTAEALSVTPPQSPESLLRIVTARDLLIGEFALAQTSVTGRSVACAIESQGGVLYTGHNIERQSPVGFSHAEPMAVQAFLSHAGNETIKRIYMAGNDPVATGQKIRDICPCADCYATLSPHIADGTELVLFEPNTLDEVLVFNADEFTGAYRPRDFSEITATDHKDVLAQLAERTDLTGSDQEIVAGLRAAGIKAGIEFYLTGSASGRGWMSNAIHKKRGVSYEDLDIVAVTSEVANDVVRTIVETAIKSGVGESVEYDETVADIWNVSGENRATQRRITYNSFYVHGRKMLDLLIATSLEEGMLRTDYRKNNFFHKIS